MEKIYRLMAGAKVGCQDLLRRVALMEEKRLTPRYARNDDVYLVSFPKSGSTWLNFLIANVNIAMSATDRTVTFYNIHQYIPDIQSSRDLGPPLLEFPGFRFIKSHSIRNRYYGHVVYIVRNPEDTMISYYYFLRALGLFSGTISELINSKRYGIKAWSRHVESWLYESQASQGLILVRYENLKSDPISEVDKIYQQLGFCLPRQVLDKAVSFSTFKEMKRNEIDLNYGNRPLLQEFQFMRRGKAGEGKLELKETDRAEIRKVASKMMDWLGYV